MLTTPEVISSLQRKRYAKAKQIAALLVMRSMIERRRDILSRISKRRVGRLCMPRCKEHRKAVCVNSASRSLNLLMKNK
jgi:hypothetical protein